MILAPANETLTNYMPYVLIGVALFVIAIFVTVLVIVARTNKLAKRALEEKNEPVEQPAAPNVVPQTLVAVTVVAQPAQNAADEPVEEPVKEEPKEEVAEEPKEEVTEEVVEEQAPVEEAPAEVVEDEPEEVEEAAEETEEVVEDEPAVVPADDDDEEDDFDDNVEGVDEFAASLNRKPSKPFVLKMQETTEENREYYSSIKNKFLQYRKITARISKKCESFRCGRNLVAKINIVGKTIRVYLALDPKKYPTNIYFQKDAGDKKAYEEVPMMMRVRSDRALRRTYTLIEGLMADKDILVKSKFVEEDYAKDIMNRPISQ